MRNTVQSVERALQVLSAFELDGQELGVSEIAGLLDVHKSTASRLAATLAASGFLERAPASESFRLGPEVARLAALAPAEQGDRTSELTEVGTR
jgi:DNA-binding IclR family transcriptional regulator